MNRVPIVYVFGDTQVDNELSFIGLLRQRGHKKFSFVPGEKSTKVNTENNFIFCVNTMEDLENAKKLIAGPPPLTHFQFINLQQISIPEQSSYLTIAGMYHRQISAFINACLQVEMKDFKLGFDKLRQYESSLNVPANDIEKHIEGSGYTISTHEIKLQDIIASASAEQMRDQTQYRNDLKASIDNFKDFILLNNQNIHLPKVQEKLKQTLAPLVESIVTNVKKYLSTVTENPSEEKTLKEIGATLKALDNYVHRQSEVREKTKEYAASLNVERSVIEFSNYTELEIAADAIIEEMPKTELGSESITEETSSEVTEADIEREPRPVPAAIKPTTQTTKQESAISAEVLEKLKEAGKIITQETPKTEKSEPKYKAIHELNLLDKNRLVNWWKKQSSLFGSHVKAYDPDNRDSLQYIYDATTRWLKRQDTAIFPRTSEYYYEVRSLQQVIARQLCIFDAKEAQKTAESDIKQRAENVAKVMTDKPLSEIEKELQPTEKETNPLGYALELLEKTLRENKSNATGIQAIMKLFEDNKNKNNLDPLKTFHYVLNIVLNRTEDSLTNFFAKINREKSFNDFYKLLRKTDLLDPNSVKRLIEFVENLSARIKQERGEVIQPPSGPPTPGRS